MMNMKRLMITIGVCAPMLMANEGCSPEPSTFEREQANQEQTQDRLATVQPPPQVSVSQERKNLVERLKRLNTENMTGCVDLYSGPTYVARYVVKGKVSSLNSYLTGKEKPQRVWVRDSISNESNSVGHFETVMVESPDYDGTYGQNADGIFFFTADTNSYVEWKGEYLFTDQCLPNTTRPLLVREVK